MFNLTQFAADFPWFFPVCAGIFGAIVGSFLNVVIIRLPKGESLWKPGSHCACGEPIRWFDNVPLLSWLILRGRARCCGRKFSMRYPFVELLTALLFAACWLKFPPAAAACWMLFSGALICATFIDLDTMTIPDLFTIGLAMVGVVLSVALPGLHGFSGDFWVADMMRSLVFSLKGMLIGSALVLWIALLAEVILKKEAMGFGDVKLMGAIGAFCGWQGAAFALFGGAIIGLFWVAAAMLVQKISGKRQAAVLPAETPEGATTEVGFGAHVPFGPMLAAGALVYVLGANVLMDGYFGQMAMLLE